jgi:hypothetical protein
MSGRRHRRQPHAPNLVYRAVIDIDEAYRRVDRCERPAFFNTELPAVAKIHRPGRPVLISLKRFN